MIDNSLNNLTFAFICVFLRKVHWILTHHVHQMHLELTCRFLEIQSVNSCGHDNARDPLAIGRAFLSTWFLQELPRQKSTTDSQNAKSAAMPIMQRNHALYETTLWLLANSDLKKRKKNVHIIFLLWNWASPRISSCAAPPANRAGGYMHKGLTMRPRRLYKPVTLISGQNCMFHSRTD